MTKDRLDSWKEIAAYLNRSVRTVTRWEREERLPVHRHLHSKQGSVYAYKAELYNWWTNRGVRIDTSDSADPFSRFRGARRLWIVAGTLAVLLGLGAIVWLAGGGRPSLPSSPLGPLTT